MISVLAGYFTRHSQITLTLMQFLIDPLASTRGLAADLDSTAKVHRTLLTDKAYSKTMIEQRGLIITD